MPKKKIQQGTGELSIANKDGDVDLSQLPIEDKVKAFLGAYEKQNPEKFANKIKKGELNEEKLKQILA